MKFATISKSLVLGLAVLLASSAFAATKATLHIDKPTTVNGTTLKPGDYKLQWDGTGPSVDVSIMQGKTVIAKVPAKLVDLNAPAQYDSAVLTQGTSGTSTLTGARFEGKKVALELGDTSDAMQAGSSK
jgi:hypothetical protein